MANILIIDDDKSVCRMLSRFIQRMGHESRYALTLADGLEEILEYPADVVLLDVRLPDGNGLEAIPRMITAPSSPEIIIITGEGDPDGAELAIRSGAWTYLEKPLSLEKMELQLERVLQYRMEKMDRKPPVQLKREGAIGNSPKMVECLDLVAEVANSDANVLITGETGTGKEVFAKMIHHNSTRSGGNFVVVDCTVLPETLVESLLFGHEKGTYTGAEKDRVGLVKEADGGTLFLDEVGDLPLTIQKDFLRVLQEKRLRPLGSNREIESDFRLVSATHQDLESMVQAGKFRKDLFFRLQSVKLELPPLRDHPGDIKELTLHYVAEICERHGSETKGFSPDLLDTLIAYDWPGNVRELIHAIERALAVSKSEPTLYPRHLPTQIRIHEARSSISRKGDEGEKQTIDLSPGSQRGTLKDVREAAIAAAEKQYLQDLMLSIDGDISTACRESGLSQSRLYHLLKKHKIRQS